MNNLSQCMNDLFTGEDFKSKLDKKDISFHNNKENAWITIDNNVYSLKNDDLKLLEIFKDYYGKDVKEFLLNNFENKERILLLNSINKRKIGKIK